MTLFAPAGADQPLKDVVEQLNNQQAAFPLSPRRNPIFATTSDLPNAAEWEGATIYVRSISCTAHSDGADWRRSDTNATL